MSLQKIRKVGKEHLSGRTLNDFVKFFAKRFPHHVKRFDWSYASTWVERFADHREWQFADYESRRVLYRVNPTKYKKMLGKYGEAKHEKPKGMK